MREPKRLMLISIPEEEPVALPMVLAGKIAIQTMSSASDPKPRTFVLRAYDTGALCLIETTVED